MKKEFLSWETLIVIEDQIALTVQVEAHVQTMLGYCSMSEFKKRDFRGICTEHISMTLFSWHLFKLLLWVINNLTNMLFWECERSCMHKHQFQRTQFFLIQRGNDTSEAKHCEPAHKASICDQHRGMDKAVSTNCKIYLYMESSQLLLYAYASVCSHVFATVRVFCFWQVVDMQGHTNHPIIALWSAVYPQ